MTDDMDEWIRHIQRCVGGWSSGTAFAYLLPDVFESDNEPRWDRNTVVSARLCYR